MNIGSSAELTGELDCFVARGNRSRGPTPRSVKAPLAWRLKNRARMLFSGELFLPLWVWLLRLLSRPFVGDAVTFAYGELRAVVERADGTVVDYGLVGRHLVVTAGKNYLAGCFPNTNEPENMKFHGFGTGNTAAALGDTALQTELTTQYASDNVRPTGSQSASTNTYTTAGTLSPDSAVAITEWGLFSSATVGAGTLFDRQVFSVINLGTTDSLTVTYTLTIS